jgi:plasmid stabilization system protein ParE
MPSAEQELEDAYEWLLQRTLHAPEWYNGLLDAVLSLEANPLRCPTAPDSHRGSERIRQLLYGDKQNAYRILFTIAGNTVFVVHIRHAARKR